MNVSSFKFVTHSPRETQAAARDLARLIKKGDVLLFLANLGAGKTTFIQGFVKALGVTSGALSPTFVVAQSFQGKWPIHHLDFYRMTPRELLDIGVDDYLTGRGEIAPGVVLIEWAERCRNIWPRERLEIHIRIKPRSTDRIFVIRAKGARFREVIQRFKEKFRTARA